MAGKPCFWNAIHVGPGNQNFTVNIGGGPVACTVTSGVYASFLEFRNAFMTAAQTVRATLRSAITNKGYLSLDDGGAGAYAIVWTDVALGYLLGFTTDLASAASHIAPRRIGASLYLETDTGLAATIEDHEPLPGFAHVSQTESLGAIRRTTRSGVRRKRASFAIRFLDNTARFTSPASAVATTYANDTGASTFSIGLTQYEHAKYRWYDCSNVAAQGWADGRRIRYFTDADNATFALSAAAWAFSSSSVYSDWIADGEACQEFAATKARNALTTKYHLTLHVCEYFSP